MVRPDGNFMIVARSGAIWISKDGILGPYTVQGPSVYPQVAGLPLRNLEDPVVWYSGGLYHIVVNGWSVTLYTLPASIQAGGLSYPSR